MVDYILKRLIQGVVVLFLVSLLTFFLINLAPGGPSSLIDFSSTAAEREARLARFGLDRPVHERYLSWLGGLVQGDLGTSINQGLPVAKLLQQRLGTTLVLALTALVLASVFGLALGVAAALNRDRWPDHAVNIISTLGMSVPSFWFGIVMIIIFAVWLGVLPAGGSSTIGKAFSLTDRVRHLVLPAGVLAFSLMPNIVRVARAAVLDMLSADFVRTARAKGLRERSVMLKHAMRNAMVPVVAILGLVATVLFSGSVVIESVFGWAGIGRLAIEAANGRDYPVILGVTLVAGVIVVVVNLLVDLAYAWIDPRVEYA
mgnify:CR=1 FL=1